VFACVWVMRMFGSVSITSGGSRRVLAISDVMAIVDAVQSFRRDRHRLPSPDEGVGSLVVGHYLDQLPIDPWGRLYVYTADGERFQVTSLGADGAAGGKGEAADIDSNDLSLRIGLTEPLQPTPAVGPNGERDTSESGRRG
jgi:general secretion pathway protein G